MGSWHELNFLDWIILALVCVSVVGSLLKGFARETISLGSVVIGILLASWFYPLAADFFLRYVRTADLAAILGFVTIFSGCLVAGAVVSFLVHKFVRLAHLQWFDRLLGAAFGLIRGWMIAAVLVLLLTAFPVELGSVQEAKLAPFLLVSARALVIVTPQSLKDRFLEGYAEIERLWREQTGQHGEVSTRSLGEDSLAHPPGRSRSQVGSKMGRNVRHLETSSVLLTRRSSEERIGLCMGILS